MSTIENIETIERSEHVTESFVSSVVENDYQSALDDFKSSGYQYVSSSYGFQSDTSSNSVNNIASDLLRLAGGSAVSYLSSSSSYSSIYLSEIEAAILRASNPIEITETELITVLGQRGIWVNRAEVQAWKGDLPITSYLINEDANPEIITKKVAQSIEYVQELAIRYLRPPTPPVPGEIIIKQEANIPTAPAPPLIIRQQPARPLTPEPLVIREAPPAPPATVGRKFITISGRRIPPPPRKVVIERLPQLPSKPQAVLIERWLPYAEVKRKVIFQANQIPDPVVIKPRNVIVQWEAPDVRIVKDLKYLGIIRANPAEYVARFGTELKLSTQLPKFVLDIKTPNGLVLASEFTHKQFHDLEGDIHALNLIDLDKEGLNHYRSYLGISGNYTNSNVVIESATETVSALIEKLFRQIDYKNTGYITVDEAERIVLRINSRLGRSYGEDDVKSFFETLDLDVDGKISLSEFKTAFLNIV